MTKTTKAPANTPSAWLTTALGSTDSAKALDAIRSLQARLTEEEHQVVFTMRNSGRTWQEIADATGMASRQAAQHRYEKSAGLVDRLNEAMSRVPTD